MVNGPIHHLRFTIYTLPLFNDPQQMRDFRDEAASSGRICALDYLIQLGQPKAIDDLLVLAWRRDVASVILYPNPGNARLLLLFLYHKTSSMQLKIFHLFAAKASQFQRVFHVEQAIERRANYIMGIVRTENFGPHVVNTNCLHDGADSAARDHARAF